MNRGTALACESTVPGIGVPLILLPKVPVAEWRFSAELCSRGLQPIDWQSSSVRCGERVLVD